MRLQDLMLKAISGELHWFRATDILGMSPRGLRRWRERYERYGYDGLIDRRCGKPSIHRVPMAAVEQLLQLYRERYRGSNVRHFHEIAVRRKGLRASNTELSPHGAFSACPADRARRASSFSCRSRMCSRRLYSSPV
jgi:hypothetical protein